MKNAVMTLLGVLVLAIATAGAAFGAQSSQMSSAMRALPDTLSRAMLQEPVSGNVAGIGNLPSTSTGGGLDGLALVIAGFAVVSGAVILIRQAIADS